MESSLQPVDMYAEKTFDWRRLAKWQSPFQDSDQDQWCPSVKWSLSNANKDPTLLYQEAAKLKALVSFSFQYVTILV